MQSLLVPAKLEGLLKSPSDVTAQHDLEPASPFANMNAVASFWKEFELDSLRQKMDEQGMAVAENQESSLKSRRRLAETTREFKKSASAELNRDVGTLLKAYQEEVDRLTTRAKFGESAFLEVYQKLYEAPDPATVLISAADSTAQIAELESFNKRVMQELADFKAESKELRNQDLTIKRLEAQLGQIKAQLQNKEEQLEQAVSSAAAETDAKLVQEMQQREESLSNALLEARASLGNMQRLHQASQNQLFTIQSQTEEQEAGLRSELEIATDEMERAQQRLTTLEREKDILLQGSSSPTAAQAANKAPSNKLVEESLRNELQNQRGIVAHLHEELSSSTERLQAEVAEWRDRCEAREGQLQAQQAHGSQLEQDLRTRPTPQQVDELRQHIKILQAVGYNAMEGEDLSPGKGKNGEQGAGAEGSSARSLEALLLAKNRHLEHELTMARLHVADLTGQSESSLTQIADLEAELQEVQRLNARLEEDLLAAERTGSRMQRPGNGHELDTSQSGFGSVLSGSQGAREDWGGEEGDNTMVKVLCSQRDRFKDRANQLELQLAQAREEAQSAKGQVEAIRGDNLALLERLKYVQGYQSQSRPRHMADPEAGEVEGRYSKAYEEKMNPFSDFRSREREARRQQMNVLDRIMFEFGQFISGSQYARVFVFCYTLALHLLIMGVLARWSHGHSQTLAATELLQAQQPLDVANASQLLQDSRLPGGG
ncbi:hypothetical protein WJX77_011900 [Trebouxia sp. C0004]